MAKKIEQTNEEIKLYNELKKLVKRANQRILRLERFTGEKEAFATKQLYDFLNVSNIQAISERGRVTLSKSYSIFKMNVIKKAVEDFLEDRGSQVREVKKIVKEYSKQAGKDISIKQANILYKSGRSYTWIYDFIPKSEFWTVANVAKEQGWDIEEFEEQIRLMAIKEIDESYKRDLEALYYYIIG